MTAITIELVSIARRLEEQRMNALQVAQAEYADTERQRIRDASIEVWQERDQLIDTRTDALWADTPTAIEQADINELAQLAEYLDWYANRLWDTANSVAPDFTDPGALPFDRQSDVTPRPIDDTEACALS